MIALGGFIRAQAFKLLWEISCECRISTHYLGRILKSRYAGPTESRGPQLALQAPALTVTDAAWKTQNTHFVRDARLLDKLANSTTPIYKSTA